MATDADFRAALQRARLRQVDLARLTGKSRSQVSRWYNGHGEVPEYVWTIVRQRRRINDLVNALVDAGEDVPA